jgi:hypothetical protein
MKKHAKYVFLGFLAKNSQKTPKTSKTPKIVGSKTLCKSNVTFQITVPKTPLGFSYPFLKHM